MNCNQIIEMSLWYIENKLNSIKRHRFESHIAKCQKCRAGFDFFKAHYKASDAAIQVNHEIITSITSSIDISKYTGRTAGRSLRRAWIVVFVSVFLLAGIAVNADTIAKSLDELVDLIGREINPSVLEKISETKEKSAEEIAISLYEKNRHEVYKAAENLNNGEVKEFTFNWDGIDFAVKVGKTPQMLTISYKTPEIGHFIVGESIRNSMPDKDSSEADQLLQSLIGRGYFVPVLDPVPEGYRLQAVSYSGNKAGSLTYCSGSGSFIMINMDSTIIKNDFSAKTLENVNGYQAVYQEFEAYGERHGNINIYLGDDKRQNVLSLSVKTADGAAAGKEQLLEIAGSIKYHNEQNNLESRVKYINELPQGEPAAKKRELNKYSIGSVINGEIFKDVKDPRVIEKSGEYIEKAKNGQSEFIIQVSEAISMKRLKKLPQNDPRYFLSVQYDTGRFGEIRQFMNIPLFMNRELYERSVLQFVLCTYPEEGAYIFDGGVHYHFYPAGTPEADIETCKKLTVDACFVTPEDAQLLRSDSITGYMVDRFTTSNYNEGTSELVYDSSQHPYIIRKSASYDITTIYTIKESENEYTEYVVIIPNTMLDGMSSRMLADGFEYIN